MPEAMASGAGSDPDFSGWYVEGSWWLTGEYQAAGYKAAGGKFDRPKIQNNVTKADWTSGGLQLAARYSMLDLDDGPSVGEMSNITVGTNWWLNSHSRFSINYIHSEYEETGVDDDADIIVARFQIDF